LCKLHHWAFDRGWASVDDDLDIIVREDAEQAVPEEIATLADETVRSPSTDEAAAHAVFLQGHRRLHGFE
jgi:putative restriction endonuclease